jgi:glycosyltransferase involved in cell wall biosynthesis
MRVLLASQQYPPETADGGIGTQTHAKAHGLARLGHEVFVVSHSPDDQRHESRDGAVTVIRIPGPDGRMAIHTLEAWWLTYSSAVAEEIASLHRRVELDLIDFAEYGAEGFTWLLNRPAVDRVATVIQLHGSLAMLAETIAWPEKQSEFFRTGTFMEGTCLRLADAVFSSSRCSADWCSRTYGIHRDAIDVIHTGVDTEHFAPGAFPKDDRPTVVFVGRINESKGAGVLVEAIAKLAPRISGLQLRLIGRAEPHIRERMIRRAAAGGREDLVEFVGYVSRDELPAHLTRAHVFAAPSLYEGGPGFVYLEAMACGLPVIGCSGSGAAEAVAEGETGFLVAPCDLDALVDSLERLLSDHGLRTRMGTAARQSALAHADARNCIKRIESFYLSVLAGLRRADCPQEHRRAG